MRVIADEGNPLSEDEREQIKQMVLEFLKTAPHAPDTVKEVCIVTVLDTTADALAETPKVADGEVFLFMKNQLWHQKETQTRAQYLRRIDGSRYSGVGLYPVTKMFDDMGRGRVEMVRIRAA